jgi:hypothetical protein
MSKPPGGDARELFIAAVVVGLPAVAEVVMEVTADDGDVPVTWIGSCGLVVSTASTILQLVDRGTCTGWAFAETAPYRTDVESLPVERPGLLGKLGVLRSR